jgi:omega-6 fatty acid desaturase (delta-12 desaturase)
MFVIYHDYVHETILQKSKTARCLFVVFGIYSLAPITIWKSSHNHHHRHNSKLYGSGIGSFPVYTKVKFEKCSSKGKLKYLFTRHPLTILFGYVFTFLSGMCILPVIHKFRKHIDSLIAFVIHFGIQGLLIYYGGWRAWMFFSIVPHFISCAIGAFLFYVQHNFPGVNL